jgi:hypothetical protein
MNWLKRFGAFWYDFVIGDDWRVAAGVVVALGVTTGLHHASVPAWWVVPAAVALLLSYSLWRAARQTQGRAARRTRNPPPS